MDKQQIQALAPLLNTRPMFGTFALGDGSGVYFCAACGRKSEPVSPGAIAFDIPHKNDCRERSHWRAIEILKLAIQDAGGE